MKYLAHVDGLRAVAVGAVLIYHFFPASLTGGFVGVDIFFVISGYLITSILIADQRPMRTMLLGFYSRRVLRIFPALILVLTTTILAGSIALLSDEYELLGHHTAAAAAFASNIAFYTEAGYFDVNADLKPLLHLWSLAVEEQFYIVWPLILVLCRRRNARLMLAMGVVTLVSFILNIVWVHGHPQATFFLPFTRAWEFALGGLLAGWKHFADAPRAQGALGCRWQREGPPLVGAALIALSTFILDQNSVFPGWAAVTPVIGSLLIIGGSSGGWFNRQVLASRPFVWLGAISYPAYLWHWPMVSFMRILGQDGPLQRGIALVVTLGLAWLTYRFVEGQIRRIAALNRRRTILALCLAIAGIGLVGLAMQYRMLRPHSASQPKMEMVVAAVRDWHFPGDRTLQGRGNGSVLILGDSHAQQYYPRFELLSLSGKSEKSVSFMTMGGCTPIPGIERKSVPCAQFVEAAFRRARTVNTVVIAASWAGFVERSDYYQLDDPGQHAFGGEIGSLNAVLNHFEHELRLLVDLGIEVYVVTSSPRGIALNPKSMVHRDRLQFDLEPQLVDVSDLGTDFREINEKIRVIALRGGAHLIDPLPFFCPAGKCTSWTDGEGPVFTDMSHVRASVVRDKVKYLDFIVLQSTTGISRAQ